MHTKQLKHHINNTGDTAQFLLDSIDKKFIKRFNKACSDLEKVVHDIRSHFPEAMILADTQNLTLYLGDRNMGDYEYEGYGKYSVTSNSEFVVESCPVINLEINL